MFVPQTQYARNGDVFIAYQELGDGPVDVVLIPPGASHLEMWWDSPGTGSWMRQMASFSRLIIFDKRGTGLSDRRGGTAGLDERVGDLEAVMDAAGSERAVLYCLSEGGPMGILFAASRPERVRGLVLHGTGARFSPDTDYEVSPVFQRPKPPPTEEFGTVEWTQRFLSEFAPSVADDLHVVETFARSVRFSQSPGDWAADSWIRSIDVRPVLPLVSVPTLVMHRAGDRAKLLSEAELLAREIPGAELVVLPGEDHIPFLSTRRDDWRPVEEFVRNLNERERADRVLATVLFSDLVGSTERAAQSGDTAWKATLGRHDALVAEEVERSRGRLVKSTGDGALAVFDAPARAVRCGLAITRAVRRLGLEARAGVHTGEVELRGDDIGGIAVHVAARITHEAGPGEVLVSSVLHDLVTGSGLRFVTAGERQLKGVPGDWSLYAAT